MIRQSDRNPGRQRRTRRYGTARQFFVRRCKELAYGGLFSSIFLLSQSPLHALVIDDIRVLSRLGQPLRAEVRVVAAPGEHLTQNCFSSVSGAGDLPAVGNVRLTLTRQLDSQILRVAGTQPMREPMSEFVLQVRCAGSPTLVRSFLVMVDPPEMTFETPAATTRPATQPAPATAPARRAAPASVRSVTPATTRSRSGTIEPGSRYLVQNGDMLSTIAARVAGRPDWSVWPIARQIYIANPGAFLMGDPNRIAQGSTVYIPRLDQVDFSIVREAVIPAAAAGKTVAAASSRVDSPAPAATRAPARIAPPPAAVAVAVTPPPAVMQMTVMLGDESQMKLQLRRQGLAAGQTSPQPRVPVAPGGPETATVTDPQPVPQTQPELPDAAATPRVALPPQSGGIGWLGWLGIGAGLLLAFLLGALLAGAALRRRLERQFESRLQEAAPFREHEHPVAMPAVASVAASQPAPATAIDFGQEPAPTAVDVPSPVHAEETDAEAEPDLALAYDEPAKVGEPETLEMPQVSTSLDLELPGVETGQTGQHEVDFELLEQAYSEDYEAQFIEPHVDPEKQGESPDDEDGQAQPTGETAQYYHLENRDPADDTPLPIELGEDEMTGNFEELDPKIVNFPKSSSKSGG